jgi:hypothetical protein
VFFKLFQQFFLTAFYRQHNPKVAKMEKAFGLKMKEMVKTVNDRFYSRKKAAEKLADCSDPRLS